MSCCLLGSVFCNVNFANHNYVYTPVKDYKEIEGWYLIKDITPEDFNQNYKADYQHWGHTKYDHTEALTIPKEIFEEPTGYLCVSVYPIIYSPSEKSYTFGGGGLQQGLKYEVLENGNIRISKPDSGYSRAFHESANK